MPPAEEPTQVRRSARVPKPGALPSAFAQRDLPPAEPTGHGWPIGPTATAAQREAAPPPARTHPLISFKVRSLQTTVSRPPRRAPGLRHGDPATGPVHGSASLANISLREDHPGTRGYPAAGAAHAARTQLLALCCARLRGPAQR